MICSFSTKPDSDKEFDVQLLRMYAEKHGISFSELIIEGIRLVLKEKGVQNANEQRRTKN